MSTITDTCPCGATFSVTERGPSGAVGAALKHATWLNAHAICRERQDDPSVGSEYVAPRTTPGYCAWWSTKPDDRDIGLLQVRAWASMATLPSHVEVRPAYSGGHLGWAAFIERDVPCRHCGSLPDEDGDHTCPNRDGECPEHG